ncbi:hypothetical protein ACFLYP_02040 [Chloroflexota bacterium]
MISRTRILFATMLFVMLCLLSGCAAQEPQAAATQLPQESGGTGAGGAEAGWRTELTYEQLMDGFAFSSPVDNRWLAMPADASPPEHVFEGTLKLTGQDQADGYLVVDGNPDLAPEVGQLPEFEFEFVQHQGYLIPVQRGLIITGHEHWNYILEPGRVWAEAGDQNYSRASFPFALVYKGSNATFNGVMTFLFNDGGVSKVWYQITQETVYSFKMDLWGLLDGEYNLHAVEDAESVRAAFERELADRFPAKPIEALAEDYPSVNLNAFGFSVSAQHMTWYGFVIDGVNYVGGCQTRYGAYPYCEYMRASSYSTAKSAFVSIAIMRLAQKYDPEIQHLLIKDFLPEAADSPGDWENVTFGNVLDMATGNFRSASSMVDEEQWDHPFWNAEYYDGMIAAAFDWPHGADPGTTWVYRSSDTFILAQALGNYLRVKEGPQADLFQLVVEEVYIPLKLSPGALTTLRTKDNNWQGAPVGYAGMWWIPDDLAKITTFLNFDGGMIDGVQILAPAMLSASLQKNPQDRGVRVGPGHMYNNSFWANHYDQDNRLPCDVWVPQMLGISGVLVAPMPNGTNYYYASDNRQFHLLTAVKESNELIPFCDEE